MRHFVLLSFTLLPLIASDLALLLPHAKQNLRVESARLEIEKSQAQIDETKTAYFPTVTATGMYQKKDKATAFEPRTIYGVELGAEITIFDGFRREALLSALKANKEGAKQNFAQEEQNILIETIAAYYDYLDTKDRLSVNAEKKRELSAQVSRYEILVQNGLATTDILKSLIASRLEVDYDEQNLRTLLAKHLKNLELLSGESVNEPIEYRELSTPPLRTMDRHDLLSDKASLEILHHSEDRYTYLPSITLQGKHKSMNYNDYDTMNGTNIQPENQNEVTASVSMTLFDMGRISKEREQARIDTLKTQQMFNYKIKQLQNEADISLLSIKTTQSAYDAALAEEEARSEAFSFIRQRFEAGLINTTTYLTELTTLSTSRAKTHHARNSLQMAKANAAYAHGIDIMTLLEETK